MTQTRIESLVLLHVDEVLTSNTSASEVVKEFIIIALFESKFQIRVFDY